MYKKYFSTETYLQIHCHFVSTLVSIIIPSFNSERFIAETLESVSAQTYMNWECLIVDDGSEDDTIGIIQEFCNRDKRFRFYSRHRPPKSASTCRNIGLEYSKGEFVVFLDSDDILIPNCLETRLAIINNYPDFDFWVFQTGHFYNTIGDSEFRWNILFKENHEDDLIRFILQDNPWSISGPLWRLSALQMISGFDENTYCWQDWELHIRALCSGFRYWKDLNEIPDVYYRRQKLSSKNSSDVLQIKYISIIDLVNRILDLIVESRHHNHELLAAVRMLQIRLLNEVLNCLFTGIAHKLISLPSFRQHFSKWERTIFYFMTIRFYPTAFNKMKDKILNYLLTRIKPGKFKIEYSSTYIFQVIENEGNW